MLQAIRDRSKGILGIVVVILLGIPFAFFGIQNYFFTQVDDVVARVNDAEISLGEFQDKFNRERARMRSQFGDALDASYFDQPLIRRQILDTMIEEEVMLQAASEAGLAVSPDRLREQIDAIDAFKVESRFDPDVYRNVLRQQGLTPMSFEDRLRRDMLLREMPISVSTSSLALPGEVAAAARLQNQTRSFEYLTVGVDRFMQPEAVSDEAIAEAYEQQADRFMTPEQVTIAYLELDAALLDPGSEPDETLLRARYEEQKLRFVLPERRLASHVLIEVPENADADTVRAARDRAQSVADRAREGSSFEELAREHSDDEGSASLGGDLGWIERDMMVSAFEDALFALEAGEISDPVHTTYGIHVIQLRNVEPSRGKTFEEARVELAQEYIEAEAERLFLEQQDRLLDLTYEDQGTLQPAADALELEIRTEGPFDRSGGEGIAAEPEVVTAAFSELVLEEGINSDPITIGPNHVVFLRVIEHIEPSRKPLDEVAEEIRGELAREQALEAARSTAAALLERARAGESLADLGAENDWELATAAGHRRNAPGHDRQLTQAIFAMPRPVDGPEFDQVAMGADRFAVVALTEVRDPQQGEFTEAQNQSLGDRISRGLAQAEINALTEALRQQAEIRVAEEKIQNPTRGL